MRLFLAPLLLIVFFLLVLISKENRLMELRLQIPKKEAQLKSLIEANHRQQTELDAALSPKALLEKLRTPTYSHLAFPESGK